MIKSIVFLTLFYLFPQVTYSEDECAGFFGKLWQKTVNTLDGTNARIKEVESLGFKIQTIEINPTNSPHKAFLLTEYPIDSAMGRVMKNAQEKLGVKFVYDPLGTVEGFGYYSPKANTIYLSSMHFKDNAAKLNTNLLHEIRHAHFQNKLRKGEPNAYLGQIESVNNKPYLTVDGYSKFLDFSELATTEKDLAYALRFGRIASLKRGNKEDLINSYATRLLQMSSSIESEAKLMLKNLHSKKQTINWTVDRSVTIESNGHSLIYADLPIQNTEGVKVANFRVFLPNVQADTPDEVGEKMLNKYLEQLIEIAQKHKRQAETALEMTRKIKE